jgi:hypothetical protein
LLARNTEAIGFKNATRVTALLGDLCLRKGICLPPEDEEALIGDPPGDLDAFGERYFHRRWARPHPR